MYLQLSFIHFNVCFLSPPYVRTVLHIHVWMREPLFIINADWVVRSFHQFKYICIVWAGDIKTVLCGIIKNSYITTTLKTFVIWWWKFSLVGENPDVFSRSFHEERRRTRTCETVIDVVLNQSIVNQSAPVHCSVAYSSWHSSLGGSQQSDMKKKQQVCFSSSTGSHPHVIKKWRVHLQKQIYPSFFFIYFKSCFFFFVLRVQPGEYQSNLLLACFDEVSGNIKIFLNRVFIYSLEGKAVVPVWVYTFKKFFFFNTSDYHRVNRVNI